MKKRILVSLFVSMFILGLSHGASAITTNVTAIPNDNIDDSMAVQQAFDRVLSGGGGTVVFPSGVIDIKQRITILPQEYKPVNIIVRSDGGGVIRVSVGSNEIAFYCGNINRLQFENVVFTGADVPAGDPKFIDARFVIFAGWVSMVNITNTSFFGLAVPSGGAIVSVASNLTINNCQFDGNNAEYPNGAVVSLDCCTLAGQNANISNTTFLDYTHFNGQYLSKTAAFTGSWVRVKQVEWTGNASTQRLTIDDCFFDEGAAWAINAENIAAVNIHGTRFNINGSDAGAGIKATNVKRVRIEDSHFGWASRERPFAILTGASVEMIGVTRSESVQCPESDEMTTVTWRLSDCK